MRLAALLLIVGGILGLGLGILALRGDDPETVRVPNIVGKSTDDATCLVIARGLRWAIADGPSYADDEECDPPDEIGVIVETSGGDQSVVKQNPAPGTVVRRGSIVRWEDGCSILRFRDDGLICID